MNSLASPRNPSYSEEIGKAQRGKATGEGHTALLQSGNSTISITYGMGPKMCTPRAELAPKEDAYQCYLPPKGTPSYTVPHFQEEDKEEQTAMVPQAIPLRRCRYCMVLVGDTGPPGRGGARLRLCPPLGPVPWSHCSRKASQIWAPTSHPHPSLTVGSRGEPVLSPTPSAPTAAPAGPTLP